MKHTKKILFLLLTAALMLMLTGCKLTPEKAIDKMNAALAQSQPTKASVQMSAEFSAESDGTASSMKMSAVADMLFAADPLQFYADFTLEMDGVSAPMKLYGLMEDNTPVFYIYDETSDLWSKSPLETAVTLPDATATANFFPDPSLVELTEDVTLPNGTTAHRLTCTVDGSMAEGVDEVLAALGDVMDVSKLDMSSLRIPMNLYLDTETFLPMQMDVSLEGFDAFVQSVLGAMMGNTTDFKFEIKDLSFEVTSFGYGEQRIPKLPEEAPLYIEIQSHVVDQGDGTYVIRSPYDAVQVTCPDGWYVDSYDYYCITLVRNDGYRAISFFTQEKASVKDSGLYAVNNVIEELRQLGLYDSDGRNEVSGDYELAWVRQSNGIFNVYGWQHLSDQTLLFVEILDGTASYRAGDLFPFAADIVKNFDL